MKESGMAGKFVLEAVTARWVRCRETSAHDPGPKRWKGVLAEIDQISGDYAKRIYYENLIKQANLDATAYGYVASVARDLESDLRQAQLLLGVAPLLTGKDAAVQTFFDAVATIESDYERGRVLKTVLKQGTPSRAVLVLVAGSTKAISSDYEKAGVLKGVAASYLDDPTLREVFFQTIGSIESDYERRGV